MLTWKANNGKSINIIKKERKNACKKISLMTQAVSHRTIEEHAYRLCPLKIWQNCQIKPIRNQIRISVHVLLNSGGHFSFLCPTCIIMMGVKSLQRLAVLSRLGGSSWEERNGDGLRAIELKRNGLHKANIMSFRGMY